VRVYNAENGTFLWQDHFHGVGNRTNIALATDLGGPAASPSEAARIRLYVAGFITSAGNNTDFVVRAYDGRNGELLWWDVFDRAGGLDEALSLAVEKGRVYAAGRVNANFNSNVFIRAYDAK
jgi:outer membrane protein assembly factor BamB